MLNRNAVEPRRASFRPQVENLEERRVMSANVIAGNLVITQSFLADKAVVSNTTIFGVPFIKVEETIGGVVKTPKLFTASSVTGRIVYNGLSGDDVFDNQTALKSTAFGGFGNDKLSGGSNDDMLFGGFGNDQMHAREGNDELRGESGDDFMRAGQGNDRMFGGTGKDDMFGALGNDYLDGGQDGVADILRGGEGADTFVRENIFRFPFFIRLNRDNPVDFNAAEGDTIVSPGLLVQV